MNSDVIIVGGGVVGLTLAALLANQNYSVVVLERKSPYFMEKKEGVDLRVRAINRASENIFKNLGVWEKMERLGLAPYHDMYVWDGVQKGNVAFSCFDVGEKNIGYIVENRVLMEALWRYLENKENVKFFVPCELNSIENLPNHISVSLKNNEKLSSKLLVAADGANSWVREQLGLEVIKSDYKQTAVVTTVQTEMPHAKTARQIFLPEGTLALLPLADPHQCSIVWATTPDHADRLKTIEEEHFNVAVTSAFEAKLGALKALDQRISFPLMMRHIKAYTTDRVAVIGDAAHTIHPLAGQGLNLGLLDAACLAEVISETGGDIGQHAVLRKYERWRKGDTWKMIVAMEGFKRLFTSKNTLLGQMRSLGLKGVDKLPMIKNQFIEHALGLKGDLPHIARQAKSP